MCINGVIRPDEGIHPDPDDPKGEYFWYKQRTPGSAVPPPDDWADAEQYGFKWQWSDHYGRYCYCSIPGWKSQEDKDTPDGYAFKKQPGRGGGFATEIGAMGADNTDLQANPGFAFGSDWRKGHLKAKDQSGDAGQEQQQSWGTAIRECLCVQAGTPPSGSAAGPQAPLRKSLVTLQSDAASGFSQYGGQDTRPWGACLPAKQ